VRAVEPSLAGLRHVEELVGHQEPFVREPAPFVTRWRSRTVANGDSITFDVRRCFQCSAGKSKKVSKASASFSESSGTRDTIFLIESLGFADAPSRVLLF
jgi:hypothetical protein